jgi:DinB superfamily
MVKLLSVFYIIFFAAKTVHLMMQNIIQELETIIQDYTPQLQQPSEESFSFKPSPSKWSGKEYLGHLIDSAQNNARRFVVAQYEDKPFIIYDQEKWVAAADYQNYPIKDLVDLWVLFNKHIVIILKNIPGEDINREVQTQELHSIKWLAEDYNKHLLHHLHQVLHLEPVAYP